MFLPGQSGPMVDPLAQQMGPSGALPGDMYPHGDEDEQKKILSWGLDAFNIAEEARRPYDERWKRYFRSYRSYIEKKPGDWRSRVHIPIAFWIIETITPRLVAQLPKFTANPMGPEDVLPAARLELLLEHATSESELYVELVKAFKSSLKYGTGIIKTFHRCDYRRGRKHMPLMVPQYAMREFPITDPETQMPMLDMNGQPMFQSERVQVGEFQAGMESQRITYKAYEGPAAEAIDIFNFYVAPESEDMDSARYVIHRSWQDLEDIKDRAAEGVYHLPDEFEDWSELVDHNPEDPNQQRLREIELGAAGNDPTRKAIEILEIWTKDGRLIVIANRKALIRYQENPFDHSEKPFVRIVDILQEHEFWGVGEIESLADMQDLQNALVNSRVDNIRLVLNAMFAVNLNNVESTDDLVMRPGGFIRIKGDYKPSEVLERIDLGDVTSSAFTEADKLEEMIQKVSGVNDYQMGLDSPTLNNTATGVAIIQEAGASRFGLKSKIAELIGLKRLGRQYGSLIQQFMTEEKQIRLGLIDPMTGFPIFASFAPDSIQGAIDVDIQSESSSQTQTMRVENKMNILSLMAQYNPVGIMPALQAVLEAMGEKDVQKYMTGQASPLMPAGALPGQAGQMMGQPALPPGQGLTGLQQMAAAGGNPAAGTQGQMMADQEAQMLAQSYDQAAMA